ncbi:hypothetical protein [Burkholderia plantarii]|uniref:hypothetical protein n=1 Tax=Burkholderia plantarii TaxID=41899 RepID=UPI0018DC98AC|nr:hypothetical protein [Burkholderia plantarii]MBI0327972.1 hypothetical protein [Burkholderia plantarii]
MKTPDLMVLVTAGDLTLGVVVPVEPDPALLSLEPPPQAASNDVIEAVTRALTSRLSMVIFMLFYVDDKTRFIWRGTMSSPTCRFFQIALCDKHLSAPEKANDVCLVWSGIAGRILAYRSCRHAPSTAIDHGQTG